MLYRLKIDSCSHGFDSPGLEDWTVHSVFRRAVNLARRTSKIEPAITDFRSLVFPESDNGFGRAIVNPASVPGGNFLNLPIKTGSILFEEQEGISARGPVVVDFSTARLWIPKPLLRLSLRDMRISDSRWPAGSLHAFRQRIQRYAATLPALSTWFDSTLFGELQIGRLNRYLREPCPEHAEKIVGLGPGLTPLGDDILVGTLLARDLLNISKEPFSALIQQAALRTSDFSAAALRDAHSGRFSQIVISMVREIQTQTEPDSGSAFYRVMSIGASSGTGLLYGFLRTLDFETEKAMNHEESLLK